MTLKLIEGNYSIYRLEPSASIPEITYQSSFYSISKTDEELSIVCESKYIIADAKVEDNWGLIKVVGPLDFSLTGILSSLTQPLAEAKISIFAISTFDTDYLLVKSEKLEETKATLEREGFSFS